MTEMLKPAARIVAAYVRNHRVGVDEVPPLIATVCRALESIGRPAEPGPAERRPAVPIRRSVTPDHIICLEDGKKLKMLKRYLRTVHGMTPEEYRARWNLPDTYPMIAPNYAAARSALAKARGLGRTRPGPRRAGGAA
jgi:predicted transcriptional regulator